MSDLYELVFDQSGRPLLKPVESPQGPEQGLVAQTAKQAERQGAAEDLRERGRVAPGEAEAAQRQWLDIMRRRAARWNDPEVRFVVDGLNAEGVCAMMAAELNAVADILEELLPEPDSGADAGK